MKALMILGSRNPEGRTATAAKALLEGVTDRGSQGEEVFLPQRKIERCRQCEMDGWGTCRTEGRCAIEDDFASLVDSIKSADAVVFATPVYFGDLSESMRAFLDRLRRVTRHSAGKEGLVGKPAIGICVAGGGGGGAPNCTVSLERVLRTCGFDVVDMVPVRRQNLEIKLSILRTTGKWLASEVP
jgi:multimeric flavodoxin WrbA